jgi:hypothetical protein
MPKTDKYWKLVLLLIYVILLKYTFLHLLCRYWFLILCTKFCHKSWDQNWRGGGYTIWGTFLKNSEMIKGTILTFWLILDVNFFFSYKFPYSYKVWTARLEQIWSKISIKISNKICRAALREMKSLINAFFIEFFKTLRVYEIWPKLPTSAVYHQNKCSVRSFVNLTSHRTARFF